MEKPYAEKPHLTSTGGSGGPMLLVLYQPDIPQNAGTILRLGVCLGVPVEIVEPAGFMFTDKHFRRAGLDYAERATMRRHASWEAFLAQHREGRLVLLTTRATVDYTQFVFRADDKLLLGSESAGAPEWVHAAADARLRIPMTEGARSLNVAVAAAMVLGEALRQTGGLQADGATAFDSGARSAIT